MYVTIRKTAEKVALFLEKEFGKEVRGYHAGMRDEEREAIQDWFLESKVGKWLLSVNNLVEWNRGVNDW